MKDRQVWIDYLRSFIILTVVIHHAALAYTTYAHFNREAYILSTHPMVDVQRWVGFDIFVYFNDIFFMSLMFLISGLFVVSSLKRKGTRTFIVDRFRRLFVPFIFGVTLIAFIAYYPSYLYSHKDKDVFKYLLDFFTTEYWPGGPAWFLWVLFIFNLIFVWMYPRIQILTERFGIFLLYLVRRPALLLICWFLITWILYVPMRLLCGPEGWASIGPFDFQLSRFLLYFGYFMLGTIIGTIPLENGLLSDQSSFMRNWPIFIILSLLAFGSLLLLDTPLKQLTQAGSISKFTSNLIYSSVFVASCIFSCSAYITVSKAVFRRRNRFWDMFTPHAFTIYLIHYIFIVWGQYLLLNRPFPVGITFIAVSLCSLILSLLTSYYLHKSKTISQYL